MLTGNSVIREDEIVIFAASDGDFAFSDGEIKNSPLAANNTDIGHMVLPLFPLKRYQYDGDVVQPSCQIGFQHQIQAGLIKRPIFD